MGDAATGAKDMTQGAQGSMFGMLDIIVLGGIAAFGVYWFVLRKKKEEIPQIKKLTVVPTLQRSESYDPSFVNKMKNSGRNVVVFFGSQTGTAEEFAGRLSKEASRYGMKGMVADPEECEMVFGLGNKTYEHYNAMGEFVDKKLQEMGATRVYKLGLGDDDANIEEDFMTWKEDFWPAVCSHFGIDATGHDVNMRQYSLTEHEPGEFPPEKVFTGEPARIKSFQTQKPPYDQKNPYLAPIVVHRELFKEGSDRNCFHIEFDITGSKIRYDAGDHIAVYPVNDPELVEKIGTRIGVDLGQLFSLNNLDSDASKRHPFPCPTTYRTALSHYLDITSPVRANVLKELSAYAEGEDKAFLEKISSNTPEGKDLYTHWVLGDRRHLLAVLEGLQTLRPPMDHVCEMLPRLNPRYYSISSSPKHSPDRIAITAILVDYTSKAGYHMKGVATSWLQKKMPIGEEQPRVPVFVRKSQFRLPFKASVPVLMIGPGTGIAPFRGFIQDRASCKTDGKTVGDTILYTGCRNRALDFLYDDELAGYEKDGTVILHVAFSRDQPEKIYVQHLLTQNAEEVWKTLDQGGHLYVCGDARHMAQDVDKALQEIVHKHGDMDEAKAQEYLKRMRSRGRYSCDVWS